tara:strand:+ start:2287 stop:3132 length:846 start_codon:yes stop_codon:yes gene_type:complete
MESPRLRFLTRFILALLITIPFGCASNGTFTPQNVDKPRLNDETFIAIVSKAKINKGVIFNPGSSLDPFPYVCSVFNCNRILVGSGVLIKQSVVITAAHCNINPLGFVSFDGGITLLEIGDSLDHPSFSMGSFSSPGCDLSLLFLEEPVEDITPVLLREEALSWRKDRGIRMAAIGFGKGIKSFTVGGSCRYYGTMEGSNSLMWEGSETHAERGDSGGAVICFNHGETPSLCGIIASVLMSKKGTVIHSSATRIDLYYKWIGESIDDNEKNTRENKQNNKP